MPEEKEPWWKLILGTAGGDVLAAIAGGLLGAKWAKGEKADLSSFAGKLQEIREKYKQDRESVMKALERAHCWLVLNLITEANVIGYIKVGDKRYREYWIVARLATVDPDARQWYYQKLDNYLHSNDGGREQFFGRLEGLNNNEIPQWFRELGAIIHDVGEDILEKFSEWYSSLKGPAEGLADDVWLTANRLGRVSDRLREVRKRKPWTISNLLSRRRS